MSERGHSCSFYSDTACYLTKTHRRGHIREGFCKPCQGPSPYPCPADEAKQSHSLGRRASNGLPQQGKPSRNPLNTFAFKLAANRDSEEQDSHILQSSATPDGRIFHQASHQAGTQESETLTQCKALPEHKERRANRLLY